MLVLFFWAAHHGLRRHLLLLAMSLDLAMIGLAFCHDPISSMPSLIPVIMVLLACTIAVGVVYNNARIALAMRTRDLASLRVLGFTRREVSAKKGGGVSLSV